MKILPFLRGLNIVSLLIQVVVTLLCLSIHEAAHAFAALKLGDKTSKYMGRISINPLKHIDPVGAICMVLFGFGWAKPVMVNPYNLKNPKRGMAVVAFAGPLSNLIAAFLGMVILKLLSFLPLTFPLAEYILIFVVVLIQYNIGLAVFNLIPIPPLDGSKVFLPMLPDKLYYDIMRYEHLGWILLVVSLSLGVLDPIIMNVRGAIIGLFSFLLGGVPFFS